MPRGTSKTQSRTRATRPSSPVGNSLSRASLQGILWRLDRLERQVKTLSELVRDHAEDADRLVRIVGEDHEALRRQLLHEHEQTLRSRKRGRLALTPPSGSKPGLIPL